MSISWGLYIIKVLHHGWSGICGASVTTEILISSRWNYFPTGFTLFTYIIFNRRCVFSMLETYYYPELCKNGFVRVNVIYPVFCLLTLSHNYIGRSISDRRRKESYILSGSTAILGFLTLAQWKTSDDLPNIINISSISQYLF